MNIELKEITVRQLTNGYQDNEEGGTATAAATTTNQKESYELYICAHGVRKRSMGAGQTAEFFADRRSERSNDSSEA